MEQQVGKLAMRVMDGIVGKMQNKSGDLNQVQSSKAVGQPEDKVKCPGCGKPLDHMKARIMAKYDGMEHVRCQACDDMDREKKIKAERMEEQRQAEEFITVLPIHIERVLPSRGVPRRNQKNTLENFIGAKPELRPGLIVGPTGTGKTHLAIGYMRREIRERFARICSDRFISNPACGITLKQYNDALYSAAVACQFISALEFVWEMRRSIRTNTDDEVMGMYCSVPFLVLDDFGAERPTEWAIECLGKLVYTRHAEMLDTIVTSNLTPEEIGEAFNNRIMSRVMEFGKWVKLEGKNARLEAVR